MIFVELVVETAGPHVESSKALVSQSAGGSRGSRPRRADSTAHSRSGCPHHDGPGPEYRGRRGPGGANGTGATRRARAADSARWAYRAGRTCRAGASGSACGAVASHSSRTAGGSSGPAAPGAPCGPDGPAGPAAPSTLTAYRRLSSIVIVTLSGLPTPTSVLVAIGTN